MDFKFLFVVLVDCEDKEGLHSLEHLIDRANGFAYQNGDIVVEFLTEERRNVRFTARASNLQVVDNLMNDLNETEAALAIKAALEVREELRKLVNLWGV